MPRTYAILADIRGNLDALEAVPRDLDTCHPDALLVLGDTVGYGPNPRECLEGGSSLAEVQLLGNHEWEAISPGDDLDGDARRSLEWSVAQLSGCRAWQALTERVRANGELSEAHKRFDGLELVHASAKRPLKQYIWPAHECQYLTLNDQIDERISEFLHEFEEEHAFFAHTHAPAVLTAYANHGLFDPYTRTPMAWNRRHSFDGPSTRSQSSRLHGGSAPDQPGIGGGWGS